MTDPDLPDWQVLMGEFRSAGFDCEQVAAICRASGVSVTGRALRMLASGQRKAPRFGLGLTLRRLHLERVLGAFDVDA
jgi:hypothetical protein